MDDVYETGEPPADCWGCIRAAVSALDADTLIQWWTDGDMRREQPAVERQCIPCARCATGANWADVHAVAMDCMRGGRAGALLGTQRRLDAERERTKPATPQLFPTTPPSVTALERDVGIVKTHIVAIGLDLLAPGHQLDLFTADSTHLVGAAPT